MAGLVEGPPLGPALEVNMELFSCLEVALAIKHLKKKRAYGPDEIPAEYWQAIAACPDNLIWITELCNKCLEQQAVPKDWQFSKVTALFKKGDVSNCENYRPISLLCVVYKVFATLLLTRLRDAGAESRLADSQFGFRRKRGTQDALFAVKRHIELAWAQRGGHAAFIALDWAKAFDSIAISGLQTALLRFGMPQQMVTLIGNIYAERQFAVVDGGTESAKYSQQSGISQGCPLSPFLFVMVMSVIMEDSIQQLPQEDKDSLKNRSLATILYADDTLLVGSSQQALTRMLAAVADTGAQYGLQLHWGKFQLLNVRCDFAFNTPSGGQINKAESMGHLGATLQESGKVTKELGRRLGMAWADFRKLLQLWNHVSLPLNQRVRVFNAVIAPQLMYGLSSSWLTVAEKRRLDGFQARCLRRVLRIPSAFISRASNKMVLRKAGEKPFSSHLLKQQLLLFGKVARAPDTDVLRSLTFLPGTLQPATERYVRKIGRPRQEWAPMLTKEALKFTFTYAALNATLNDEQRWQQAVHRYCLE